MDAIALPPAPGTYVLHLHLGRSRRVLVGRLGEIRFRTGEYFYVGSALGPGGLRARLGRHLRGDGQARWHVDALRAVAQMHSVCYAVDEQAECEWSQALAALPGAFIPAPSFGSSDCRSGCRAHLIAFPPGATVRDLADKLPQLSGVCYDGW